MQRNHRTHRTRVVTLVVCVRDHVRVKQVVVASAHLLNDGNLSPVGRAGGFVAPAQDPHVWCVMYVVCTKKTFG